MKRIIRRVVIMTYIIRIKMCDAKLELRMLYESHFVFPWTELHIYAVKTSCESIGKRHA
jgi:hypothetical protein